MPEKNKKIDPGMPSFKPNLSKIIPIVNNKANENKPETNENCSGLREYEVSDVDISEISGSNKFSMNELNYIQFYYERFFTTVPYVTFSSAVNKTAHDTMSLCSRSNFH